ncbi:MAG TPA: DNA repair protein RadA, partial [Deltaproteobacteria bacterium]|nr:DNA repair protein RadA [Deltaproteobacteria bacterium]
MAKSQQVFLCEACGYETYKWLGKCPRCAAWDTFREVKIEAAAKPQEEMATPVLLANEDVEDERDVLGMGEMDRVLGGGLTRGSSILLGGDPGIGKTTLCFEIAARMAELGFSVLYVSGEESLRQLSGRKRRLSIDFPFAFLATNRVEDILHAVHQKKYHLVIIDSIQAVYSTRLPFLPGSTSQIREVSSKVIRELKKLDLTHIFIGHVTKEGAIAGPKILEHMVDTVLYFEGDKTLPYRMIRVIKNRYGPVDEIGLFQMRREGLVSVEPSLFFLSERDKDSSGSSLYPAITGSRPLLLEVQALTPKTGFSMPKKLGVGYDMNRLFIMTAVIEKVIGLPFFDRDVYVNVTGGIKVSEPGIDLSVVAA